MLALVEMRLDEKRQAHSNRQNRTGYLSTMRGIGRPDLAVFKPEKYGRGNHPGRKGDGDLERRTRPCFQGTWHAQILSGSAAIVSDEV